MKQQAQVALAAPITVASSIKEVPQIPRSAACLITIKLLPAVSYHESLLRTLVAKIIDLSIQGFDHVVRAVNGSPELATLSLPAVDSVLFRAPAPLFGVDLVAELAFLADGNGLHNQFHATRFARTVFSVAVLSEVSPFPIATSKSMLVEKAHVHCFVSQSASVAACPDFSGSVLPWCPYFLLIRSASAHFPTRKTLKCCFLARAYHQPTSMVNARSQLTQGRKGCALYLNLSQLWKALRIEW